MPHHLDTFTIHQFRGLHELDLSDLGQVNLLVGVNNSGKTSVLEALLAYASPLNLEAWIRAAVSREASLGRLKLLQGLSWLFPRDIRKSRPETHEREIHVASQGFYPVRRVSVGFRELIAIGGPFPDIGSSETSESAPWDPNYSHEIVELAVSVEMASAQRPGGANVPGELWETISRTYHIDEDERLLADTPEGAPSLPVHLLSPYGHRFESAPADQFTEARLEGFKDSVVALVRSIDPNVRGIEILAPRGRAGLYVDHAVVGLAPLSAFGDGLRRSIAIALALPALQHGLLLIDEIETSIHISALPEVFSWLVRSCKELDIQLFATTHSLEAVDAILGVEAKTLNEVVAYRLEGTNGSSAVRRFSGDMLHRLRYERGLDVR